MGWETTTCQLRATMHTTHVTLTGLHIRTNAVELKGQAYTRKKAERECRPTFCFLAMSGWHRLAGTFSRSGTLRGLACRVQPWLSRSRSWPDAAARLRGGVDPAATSSTAARNPASRIVLAADRQCFLRMIRQPLWVSAQRRQGDSGTQSQS